MRQATRYSRKRAAILNCLQNTSCHPSAEWIYSQLKPEFPDLSLGTVYRNLSAFKREGLAISLGTLESQEHFDGRVDPHSHFFCTGCGAIIDAEAEPLSENIIDSVQKKNGVSIKRCSLNFYGLCPDCLKK